jgi:hypothetical protein
MRIMTEGFSFKEKLPWEYIKQKEIDCHTGNLKYSQELIQLVYHYQGH